MSAPTRARIGLWGQLGSTNVGNDGSLEAVLGWLAEAQPNAVIDSMCTGGERVRSRYGLPITPMHWYPSYDRTDRGLLTVPLKVLGKLLDAVRTVRWVRCHDVVIVPGTGVLESTLPLQPWGLPYALFTLCAAGRLTGTKIVLLNVGADEIVRPSTRRLITWAARLASHRSFRDRMSQDVLRRAGVPVDSDPVVADLTFSLPVPVGAPAEPGTVGVGVMSWYGADGEQQGYLLHARYLGVVCGFVRWLLESGRRVRLLTGDQVDNEVVDAVRADVVDRGIDPAQLVIEPIATLDDLLWQMAGVDSVVATRYHAVVGALRLAKPTISLSYSTKSDVLMSEMGLAEFCHPARSADLHQLMAQFSELERHGAELRESLGERSALAAGRLSRQADELSVELFGTTPEAPRERRGMSQSAKQVLWQVCTDSLRTTQRALGSVGLRQSEARISADAQAYWSAQPTDGSKARSHWRDAHSFAGNDVWLGIGKRHLDMYARAARTVGRTEPMGRVLEWGCGGGANAIHFAPFATEFVGVEISQSSLDESARQLAEITDTPFRPILAGVDNPEESVDLLGGPVDLFLCVYVFELIPSPEYGARLLRIAASVLAPDGIGIIQIKYSTDSWWTKSRRRHYRSGMADMTTYSIESFWELVGECGLQPVTVEIVPKDDLDERYAYFTVTRAPVPIGHEP